MPSSFITGPFTFQISYSEAALVRCLADFVKLHRWRLVITIYENDALGWVSNTNLLLEEALRANGSKIEYHAIFQPQNSLSDWEKTVEAELRQMMQYESTVYIVLQSSEGLALSLFKKALELNLISPRYTWICSNDITDLFNSTLPPTFIANNMQGVIGIKSYINESAEYKDFSSKFQKMFISDYGKNDENFYNPGVYAVRAYDALHAISLASNESKMKNTSLAEALSLVNFQGLSGAIVPTNHTINNMEMKLSYYEIFGIVRRNSANLGFWHDDFGFNPDMKNISSLYKLPGNQPSGLRPLKVGIPAKPVWKNFVNVNTTINCISAVDNSAVTGFCVDVFIEALNFLKYNVSYHFVAYTTERNSSCKVTKYNDLVNLVNSQEVDLVVGDVTILASRSKNVSFTQPFLTSELVMLVPTENTHIGWLSVKPFSRVGSYHTKIVLLWWFLLVQVLLSSFTASLSSILVTEKLPLSVNNLKIGCSAESFVYDYLKSTLNYKTENLVKIDTADEFTYAFDRKIITAAYLELPYLRVFLSEHKNYAVNGESRTLGGFGFVFPDGSPLRDDFSKAILRLHENGRIMALQRKWFNVSLSSSPYPVKPNKTKSLGLQNFEYLFIIFTGFAILTTLHKFIHKWWTSQTNHTEL
ncbi:Glutamate receptor [Rhynchospora pubera]|uniref:Glutamate receptor n=1 Tax=Rhynchospora pubera TaxID=906938 RepID=A0AAV8DP98_9POAL|nr:Glutamate receptor [Rhynchospora pubera]